ncbi:isoprenylcysteine carboxyl methyltransferase family protein [Desmospora activa]|uniref:Methyltransferase n=1 Tax=Desmospora activa DSM 45169 TaxID=1121389 RepID=A0A2T4Z6X4_9BACL|nr:isoprenylcysteine carboxylmethyltransferase family protein [Desmospora activa]PTM57643.1 methyltransferase [Desmospora activa DSM 45169]
MSAGIGWILAVLGLQRGLELWVARRHSAWARAQGGVEAGREHYSLLVGVHLLFFVGLAVEVIGFATSPPDWWPLPLALFLLAQALRIWCLVALGPYWNTRIWVIPAHPPVTRGPYRYLRHPNYVVVVIELLTLPLALGAWVTAITVSLLNLWVLMRFRIPTEEAALAEYTDYQETMAGHHRWLPFRSR